MKYLLRPILTVASGTVVAQGLAFVSMLYLARIYTPSEFGAFAAFSALVYISGVLATLRYDQAVMLPLIASRARSVAVLAVFACSVLCLLLVLLIYGFGIDHLARLFEIEALSLAALPLAIALFSYTSILLTWQNRQEKYGAISYHRIFLTLSTAMFQVLFGAIFAWNEFGLIAGFLLGYVVSLPILFVPFLKLYRARESHMLVLLGLAKRYRNFPKINLWDGLSNQFSNNIQSILLMRLYAPSIVGFLAVGQKLFTAPLSILSEALRMVIYRQLAKERTSDGASMQPFKVVGLLQVISIPPSISVAFFAGDIFAFILGEEWREAGRYTALLLPMYIMQFSVSPFISYFIAMEKQLHGLLWNLARASLSILALYVGWLLDSAYLSVFLYGMAHAAMYGAFLLYLKNAYAPSIRLGQSS